MNEDVQAGTAGLEYAGQKGFGVIIMEPPFGGTLANPPGLVQETGIPAPAVRPTCGPLAWDKAEVSVVLSGMSSMGQVQENSSGAARRRWNTPGRRTCN